MRYLVLILLASLLWAGDVEGGDRRPVKVSPGDKCPVCGMFVKKYPDWVAEIVFRDGSHAVFDGAKDLFRCYYNLGKYYPGRRRADIDAMYVTDYYSLDPVDALKACYVAGSDVHGPMGKELVPFRTRADATQFMKDHKGQAMLGFADLGPDLLKSLE